MSKQATWLNLGTMDYAQCWELQKRLVEQILSGTRSDTLLFVTHPAVLTLGANFHAENLMMKEDAYKKRGIEVVRTDRGGDVTYHGPGQLVIYPLFDLKNYGQDLHQWMRMLEEIMIMSLEQFGIQARRFPPHTGAWVHDKKIAAIGIKIRRWVSMHGIALNCNNPLNIFELFVPCGIKDYGVTSISEELRRDVTPLQVIPKVIQAFEELFGLEINQDEL